MIILSVLGQSWRDCLHFNLAGSPSFQVLPFLRLAANGLEIIARSLAVIFLLMESH